MKNEIVVGFGVIASSNMTTWNMTCTHTCCIDRHVHDGIVLCIQLRGIT
ncbi:MAG: hypothetical protein OXC46_06950 [Thaumarchaeota archaeon]|nr:hypothetical protein [Nitrososphaerota archaeon]